MSNLVLHAVIVYKPYFKTKEEALAEAHHMFPNEKTKTFGAPSVAPHLVIHLL